MWRYRWMTIGAAAALVSGCATPGATGSPGDTTFEAAASAEPAPFASAVRASAKPAPAPSGEALCARGATPMPSPYASASFDAYDARQRARRALEEQRSRPTATRGAVPRAAVPGAEACVYVLRTQFSLLTAGSRTIPDPAAIGEAVRSVGLTRITVSGPSFAASTGAACIQGTFTASGPDVTIAPLADDGSCDR